MTCAQTSATLKLKNMNEIIPGFVFLGNARAPQNMQQMKECEITNIVNLAGKYELFDNNINVLMCHFADSHNTENVIQLLGNHFCFICV